MKYLFFLLLILSLSSGCKKDTVSIAQDVLVYRVTASQSGTAAPNINVHENTIGNIQWTRISEGVYHGELDNAFPLDKTFSLCDNGISGFISADIRHWDTDFIELRTFSGFNEFGNPQPSDGCGNIDVEILVYP